MHNEKGKRQKQTKGTIVKSYKDVIRKDAIRKDTDRKDKALKRHHPPVPSQ